MRTGPIVTALLAFALNLGSATAFAAQQDSAPGADGGGMMRDRGMASGMMGPEMMRPGMMGMMNCPMMSGGMMSPMMGRGGMFALPPGNEKLQLQMQAEIMQKVGEIVAKYANQIQQRP
jgi:hypothetical protein